MQAAAIPPALEGRDLRVTAQTGSGKTAALLLPLLNRLLSDANSKQRTDVRSLILLPTRELAQQILKEVERFAQYTFIKAGLVTGGEGLQGAGRAAAQAARLLIATPGRLMEHLHAGSLKLNGVEVLVLDEADRMLDLGFAEDIERITHDAPTASRPCCSPPPAAARYCAR